MRLITAVNERGTGALKPYRTTDFSVQPATSLLIAVENLDEVTQSKDWSNRELR